LVSITDAGKVWRCSCARWRGNFIPNDSKLKCGFCIPPGDLCWGKQSVDGYFDPFYVAQSVTLLGCCASVETNRTNSLLSRPGFLKISWLTLTLHRYFWNFTVGGLRNISSKNLWDGIGGTNIISN
jgi:hypothetical protein